PSGPRRLRDARSHDPGVDAAGTSRSCRRGAPALRTMGSNRTQGPWRSRSWLEQGFRRKKPENDAVPQSGRMHDHAKMSLGQPRTQCPHWAIRVGRAMSAHGAVPDIVAFDPGLRQHQRRTWRAPAEKYFKGEIIVGKDLMVI